MLSRRMRRRSRRRKEGRRRLRQIRSAAIERLEERTLLAGIWISPEQVMALPTTGDAWNGVLAAAQQEVGLPNLQDQDEATDVLTLAQALVGVRLDDQGYLSQVRDAIMAVIGTESVSGSVTLADPSAIETTATFSEPGTYLLRLRADDGQLNDEDEQTIRVHGEGDTFTPTGDAALDASGEIVITGSSGGGNGHPEAYAGADQIVSVKDVVTLRGGVKDDGRPSGNVTVTWEVVQPRTLALGRNLVSYVIAADLVGLEPARDTQFRDWLRGVLTEEIDGRTLQSTHEGRPNNWGTMAAASRAAVAIYLGDQVELDRTAQVFKGYLGDRSAYAGFTFGDDLSWQADPANPVGVNPKGATKDGYSIDGAQPEEMRRGGPFQFPPKETQYPWEGLQGSVVAAEILHRAGYDSFQWQDQAILRAVEFLNGLGWSPTSDDEWIPWVIDAHYGTKFAANEAITPGKNMGWTSWTHRFGAPGENWPSVVDAGRNQTVSEGTVVALNGAVNDDGLPDPPAKVTTQWVLLSSPTGETATFADPTALDTTVRLGAPGTYVLQLSADDGELTVTDDITLTVLANDKPVTVSFQDGLDGYTGTRDTRIRGDDPTTNFGTRSKLELDGKPDQISLIRWDTRGIPADSTVTSTSITFNVVKTSVDDFEVYEALRPWKELTATFDLASTGQPWEVPGAAGPKDHAGDVLASLTAPLTGLVTIDLNALGVAMVQKWVADPSSNRGIVIQDLTDKTTDDLDVSSREKTGLGPKLTVTYSVGPPPPPNHPPTAVDDSYRVDEDGTLNVPASQGVVSNDTDPDGDPLTAKQATGSTHGSLTLNNDGSFAYTPNGDYNGVDTFTYRASDGIDTSAVATVTLTVDPVNDAPVASDQNLSTEVDKALSITLVAVDIDGDPLTYTVSSPSRGTLTGTAPNLTYTPNGGFTGTDTLTYQVNDGVSSSAVATVTITVSDATPITVSLQDGLDGYTGTRDTRIRGDNPATNYGTRSKLELDGKPDQISLIRWDTRGIPAGGTVTSASITFNVVKTSVDDFEVYEALRPWKELTATFDLASTGQPWEVPGAAGPKDHAGDVLASLTAPLTGLVTIDLNALGVAMVQKWVADPSSNRGIVIQDLTDKTTDDLDVSSREETGLGPKLTVTYTLDSPPPPNHPPTAVDDSYRVDEDTTLSVLEGVGVLMNDSDPESDSLTASVADGPSSGTLTLNADGSFTYTPNENFNGQDIFTYRDTDRVGNTSPVATVAITVDPRNDAPVADDSSTSTPQDTSVAIPLSASDVDGDPLSYVIDAAPSNGTLTGTAPNLTYTPRLGFAGLDRFTFYVNDGFVDSPLATVLITVNAINDPPVAEDLNLVTSEGVAVSIALSGSDVEGDPLSYLIVSSPTAGSLQGTAPNLTYTPYGGFIGIDTFTYRTYDGSSVSDVATVIINVTTARGPVAPSFQDGVFPTPGYRGTRGTKTRGDFSTLTFGAPGSLETDGNPDIATLLKWMNPANPYADIEPTPPREEDDMPSLDLEAALQLIAEDLVKQ
ncbi:MAG: Ig-like domain-containing protein [Pirellulaceae bacterium]